MSHPEHQGSEEDTRQVRFKEILIVDQDEAWALVMRDAVAGGGFTVALAPTIEEAVRKVRQKAPDLVLLSCLLDVDTAQALLREIDALKAPPPVILVGLRYGDAQWDAWKERRYVSFVKQPFRSKQLLDMALALLGTTWEELTGGADSPVPD
jgi:DNA-binding NtrC family response regulator